MPIKSVQLKKLHEDVKTPEYQSKGAGAFDLHAFLPQGKIELYPGDIAKVPTGLCIWIGDPDFKLGLWERSGLASRGIRLGAGFIDSDYQGQILVVLHNIGEEMIVINHQDRIAQAELTPVWRCTFEEVSDFLMTTERGTDGFGSTDRRFMSSK